MEMAGEEPHGWQAAPPDRGVAAQHRGLTLENRG